MDKMKNMTDIEERFEDLTRKSMKPNKQMDFIAILINGTIAKLGENEMERIINAAIAVDYGNSRYEWRIEKGIPILNPTDIRICLKNVNTAAIKIGSNPKSMQYVFFPDKQLQEPFSIFGVVENSEFTIAFCYAEDSEEIAYICEDKAISNASDLYTVICHAWMEGETDGREEVSDLQQEKKEAQWYIDSEIQ